MSTRSFPYPKLTFVGLMLLSALCGCGESRFGKDDPPPVLDSPDPTPSTSDSAEVGEPYFVKFDTSKGDVVIKVNPAWAPRGAKRFRELVESGYYDQNRFFRVVPGFVVQWGLNGSPAVTRRWREKNILDDPVQQSNSRGTVTFATSGPNSRTTQVFINFGNNQRLDSMGFSPFGRVVEGMDVVDAFNAEYEQRPDQGAIQNEGNAYLNREFPRLDYIKSATILDRKPQSGEGENPSDDKQPAVKTKKGGQEAKAKN